MPEQKQYTLGELHKMWAVVKANTDFLFAYVRGTPSFGRAVANGIEAVDDLFRNAYEVERMEAANEKDPECELKDQATEKLKKKLGMEVKRELPGKPAGATKGRPNVRALPKESPPEPEAVVHDRKINLIPDSGDRYECWLVGAGEGGDDLQAGTADSLEDAMAWQDGDDSKLATPDTPEEETEAA